MARAGIVDSEVQVSLTLTLDEAWTLRKYLADEPIDHPTDAIFNALAETMDAQGYDADFFEDED